MSRLIQNPESSVTIDMNDPRSIADPALRLIADAASSFAPAAYGAVQVVLGGALLDEEKPAKIDPLALQTTLARLEDVERAETAADAPFMAEVRALPPAARDAALAALAAGRTWKWAAPGIRVLDLPVGGAAETSLIRVEPGFGPPAHDHGGDEFALILTGAYHDGHGRYQAGELHVAPPGYKHRPVAEAGETCYVLAAVYGSGLRFSGLIGLWQRLSGR